MNLTESNTNQQGSTAVIKCWGNPGFKSCLNGTPESLDDYLDNYKKDIVESGQWHLSWMLKLWNSLVVLGAWSLEGT